MQLIIAWINPFNFLPTNSYFHRVNIFHPHNCDRTEWFIYIVNVCLHLAAFFIDDFMWMFTIHSCGEGRVMTPDGKGCADRNECLDLPCMNGAECINLEPRLRYRCVCPDGFWGENCELIQEGQTLKLSMGALAAILVCLLIILSEWIWDGYSFSENGQMYSQICRWLLELISSCSNHLFHQSPE